MKRKLPNISSPAELDRHLQQTSISTWVVLGVVIASLLAFFAWSFFGRIPIKISGKADVTSSQIILRVDPKDHDRLAIGQIVYILDQVGEIVSLGDPVLAAMPSNLPEGEYDYRVVLKEAKPIDFLLGLDHEKNTQA